MQKKTFFFAGAILCLLVAGWGYYQYQKPRAAVAGLEPVSALSAEQLYTEYSSNETGADKKYSGKVLQVTGNVKEIQATANGTNILLTGADTMGDVNCSFEKAPTPQPAVGERITVKGRCTGFLMDVSLVETIRITD